MTTTVCESDPLVPVTVTVNVPLADAVQDSVAVRGEVPNVTLDGRVQVKPAGVDAETDRLTVPVRPLSAVTVIVEVPEPPGKIWAGETVLAAIVKSDTVNVIVPVVWDSVPSVPVSVTVYVPAALALHDRVSVLGDVPKVTLAGREHVRPVGVEADTEVVTVPVRLLSAVTVTVEVPEAPASIWAGETAPADILKSVTCQMIMAVLTMEPLVPVTTTE